MALKGPSRHSLRSRRRGITILYVVIAMTMLLGLTSLAVDYARVQCAKTELLQAATASARGAVVQLSNGVTATQNAAVTWGSYNTANGHSVVIDPNNDVVFGSWDSSAHTFTALSGSARTSANAVQVSAHLAKSRGTGVTLTFGQIFGQGTCDVDSTAIAVTRGSGYEFVGINSLTMSGGSSDSYYSGVSPTGYISSPNGQASLASNGLVTLSGGSTCDGTVALGPSGSTSFTGGSSANATTRLSQPLSYPNSSAGSAATSNNNSNVPGSYLDGSRNFDTGGSTVSLPGGIYYFNNFTVGNTLTFTGPATIYVTGTATWNKTVTACGNIPGNLQIYMCSSNPFTANGNLNYCATVYAPQSVVKLQGGCTFLGSVVGLTLTISGGGNIYCDQSYSVPGSVSIVR